jgi:hypothetical protein
MDFTGLVRFVVPEDGASILIFEASQVADNGTRLGSCATNSQESMTIDHGACFSTATFEKYATLLPPV